MGVKLIVCNFAPFNWWRLKNVFHFHLHISTCANDSSQMDRSWGQQQSQKLYNQSVQSKLSPLTQRPHIIDYKRVSFVTIELGTWAAYFCTCMFFFVCVKTIFGKLWLRTLNRIMFLLVLPKGRMMKGANYKKFFIILSSHRVPVLIQ